MCIVRNQVPIEVLGFLLLKIERGNARGRKGSIRDLQSDRQLHRCGTDRIHREWDKLRHVGSAPRHSSDQQELLLSEAEDCAADHKAEVGADCRRTERAVEDGVVGIESSIEKRTKKWYNDYILSDD